MGAELPPRRGMLGPVGPDEFPVFDGKQMPARLGKGRISPRLGTSRVIMWVRSISDSPSGGRVTAAGFEISGSAFGVGGVLAIHHDGYGNWWIATTIPVSWEA